MRPLKVNRYLQNEGTCAVASAASVANYFNPNIDFDYALALAEKYISKRTGDGMWASQTVRLLNHLGFKKIKIVSSDVDVLDYGWSRLSQKNLIRKINQKCKLLSYWDKKGWLDMVDSLKSDLGQNSLVIDYCFRKHIQEQLKQKMPVLLSFNWTMFFKCPKYNESIGKDDAMKGDCGWHEVVCVGCTNTGAYIVDSHHEDYKYRLRKYKKGRYHVRWDELMICMGQNSDLIIPQQYDPAWVSEI